MVSRAFAFCDDKAPLADGQPESASYARCTRILSQLRYLPLDVSDDLVVRVVAAMRVVRLGSDSRATTQVRLRHCGNLTNHLIVNVQEVIHADF